ncbi:MAG TPA: ATP-grasp domain-containing protein [Pseudonocardiaceae bacterium]
MNAPVAAPVVAVVEPFSSAAMLAPALRAAGFSPVAVVNQADDDFAVYHSALVVKDWDAVVNHHGDIAATVRRLGALSPTAVIPGIEGPSLDVAQQLADALTPGHANVAELVAARRHKYAMHRALAEAGMPIIRQVCTSDAAEVADWIDREGLAGQDLVIKPPNSAGTVGMSFVPGGEGWRERFEAVVGTRDKLGVQRDEILVQEHVTGTEFAIDTVSSGGRHSVTDLLRYRRVRLGRGMAIYDSVEWLPYDRSRYGELLDYGLAALDAVGLRNWAAHTEIIMTDDGPRLMEINPRLAGAGNPAVTMIATGESQVTRIVDVCAGRGPELPEGFTLRQHVMAVFLIAHSTGTVRNAEILEEARALPSYHSPVRLVTTGDRVEATTDILTSMTMGYVILAADDRAQLDVDREAIRALEKQLVID